MKKSIFTLAAATAMIAPGIMAGSAQASAAPYNYEHIVSAKDITTCRSLATSMHNTVTAKAAKNTTTSEFVYGCTLAANGTFYAADFYFSSTGPVFTGDTFDSDAAAAKIPVVTYEHGPYSFSTKADCTSHYTNFVNQIKATPSSRMKIAEWQTQCYYDSSYRGYVYDTTYTSKSSVAPLYSSEVRNQTDASNTNVFSM